MISHAAIYLFGAMEKVPGEEKEKGCSYLMRIGGRVLDKVGEDKIKSIAGGIN